MGVVFSNCIISSMSDKYDSVNERIKEINEVTYSRGEAKFP